MNTEQESNDDHAAVSRGIDISTRMGAESVAARVSVIGDIGVNEQIDMLVCSILAHAESIADKSTTDVPKITIINLVLSKAHSALTDALTDIREAEERLLGNDA